MQHHLRNFGKRVKAEVGEEHHPQIQALASSKHLICSTFLQIENNIHEVLLDSGSSISSISETIVNQLKLKQLDAPQYKYCSVTTEKYITQADK